MRRTLPGTRPIDQARADPDVSVTTVAQAVIVYRSRATTVCSDTDLFYLLAQARDGNLRAGLTGLLVYDRGYFFQWIEGAVEELAAVWKSIQADSRHAEIKVLAHRSITVRQFAGWAMGFAHRDGQHAKVVHGYIEAAADFLTRLHHEVDDTPALLASLGSPA